VTRTAHEYNERHFRFFRRIRDRVSTNEAIEGYVLWASSIDALAQIHARRISAPGGNRRTFVRALLDLAPSHALSIVSVPMLHHELKQSGDPDAQTVLSIQGMREYANAASMSLVWSHQSDRTTTAVIEQRMNNHSSGTQKLILANRYAELLYEEYRCSPVHGLDLGWRTFPSFHRDEEDGHPAYSNYMYLPSDDRPPERRYRTRICFAQVYLSQILTDAIDELERQCDVANWRIPAYATIED